MRDPDIGRGVAALERVALLLAALYADHLGDVKQGQKAERLSRLGFSNAEIAAALGTTANSVNVSRVKHRRRKRNTPED